jgi:hypothetical protein
MEKDKKGFRKMSHRGDNFGPGQSAKNWQRDGV